MHILKNIKDDTKLFVKKIKERNSTINIEKLLLLDKENRKFIKDKEELEYEKKNISQEKDKSKFTLSKNLSLKITSLQKKQNSIQKEIYSLLSVLPNIALDDVPVGRDEKNNKVLYEKGEINKFDFKPLSHYEIGQKLKLLDFDIATKTSGSRFVFIKDEFAKLERALSNFMLDVHTQKFGYKEISPPLIANSFSMFGTGQLPKFENDQFEITLEDKSMRKFLIPTAEVILTNMYQKTIIAETELPIRLVASTPCFRKEAGSYGKDTKGMIRQHQFSKVELVSIVTPNMCAEELERMTDCAEYILKSLKLPYRKVLLSSGDMGFSAEKTYDLEVWLPSENKYREISSCSSCGQFQAKRMQTKYKDKLKSNHFVSTLNGSALAIGRTMIAFIENYQEKDGSINIPEILRPYMGDIKSISKI